MIIPTALALAFVFVPGLAAQEPLPPIEYRLTFPEPHTHYLEVEGTFPASGQSTEVMMAVWTPGSYLVREYSRHVENVAARTVGGRSLQVVKKNKNRWSITTDGVDKFVLTYRVYCRERGVRTNWVEHDYAVLNGAPTFLTLAEGLNRPHRVRIELPKHWGQSWSGMPAASPNRNDYLAPDFDTLVDSPIMVGNPHVEEFEVSGKKHYLISQGGEGLWDFAAAAADVKKIVEENLRFWGSLPYDRYLFMNLINEGGGGLEHKNSTLMLTSRWNYRVPDRYRRWLGLVSHEYFHTWNVKRLRPKALGPFDYENEVYTRSLWIAEGVTSYYGPLLLKRAGLINEKQYFKGLSRGIENLQTTPGRLVRSVERASFDAWIKHYRPDENSPNVNISYYTKGAVIGFLLDARIRRLSRGRKSLDDVMRQAYRRYSGASGYTPEEFRRLASQESGVDLAAWLETALETTEELDFREALDYYGLRFKDPSKKRRPKEESFDDPEGSEEKEDEPKPGWFGLRFRDRGERFVVTQVRRGTPAHRSGINVEDEILAIDGYRVDRRGWEDRLKQYQPGDRVDLLVSRQGRLMTLPIEFAEKPPKVWQLEKDPESSKSAQKRRADWLSDSGR